MLSISVWRLRGGLEVWRVDGKHETRSSALVTQKAA